MIVPRNVRVRKLGSLLGRLRVSMEVEMSATAKIAARMCSLMVLFWLRMSQSVLTSGFPDDNVTSQARG